MSKFLYNNKSLHSNDYADYDANSNYNSKMQGKASNEAIIYRSELDFISRCILDCPNIETGGELFGFWTQMGTPVVLYAVGPGPNAIHQPTSFIQDSFYVDNIEVELCKKSGLQHIGQWHSHHQLNLAHPSRGDVLSMQQGVGRHGFPRMLLCIGNLMKHGTTINAFNFHENSPYNFVHAYWNIIDIESPFRNIIANLFGYNLYVPSNLTPFHGKMFMQNNNASDLSHKYRKHWLTENIDNVELMKSFHKFIIDTIPEANTTTEITENGEPILSLYGGNIKILFPYDFPDSAPIFVNPKEPEDDYFDKINLKSARIWKNLSEPLDIKFNNWFVNTNSLFHNEDSQIINPKDPSSSLDPYMEDNQNLPCKNKLLLKFFRNKK